MLSPSVLQGQCLWWWRADALAESILLLANEATPAWKCCRPQLVLASVLVRWPASVPCKLSELEVL